MTNPTDQNAIRSVDDMARRIVETDVRYCVSALIYALSQREQDGSDGIDPDDLLHVSYRQPDADDYRDAAPSDIDVAKHDLGWSTHARGEMLGTFLTELEAWEGLFEREELDHPDGSEVFEHWLVTDWLAAKLRAKGEAVADDICGLTVWGRCTSGQAIYADAVLQDIARDVLAPSAEG